jgi:hypothetical protein
LAGILDGELDLTFLVPIGVDLQAAFADPFCIILVDGSDFEVVLDAEFLQSGPD